MKTQNNKEVRLRVHLSSPPQEVFECISTNAGRKAFWAESAEEHDGIIHFHFSNGTKHQGKILDSQSPKLFSVEYFGGSIATFVLFDDGSGGTDVSLTETNIPNEWFNEQRAGWVSVLLALKVAVDFSIDLRNKDPNRSWEKGYVDV